MNSENSKTFKPHVLILNVTDKIDFRRDGKCIALPVFIIHAKTWKTYTAIVNLRYQLQHGMIVSVNRQIYIKCSRLFWLYFKKRGENTDNSSTKKNVNKIENRITFKIKTGYYLEFLTSESIKSFQKFPRLERNEVLLVHFNIVRNDYH